MPRRSRAKGKGELLSRFGTSPRPPQVLKVPGFDGPRPLLSFILKALSGRRYKLILQNLQFHFQFDLSALTPEMDRAIVALCNHPELFDHAATSFIETMRDLADMWIDSGKSRTDPDVDTPADRNVEDVVQGRRASLFTYLNIGLFDNYPRYTGMRRDGTQEVIGTWPRFWNVDFGMGLIHALETYGRRMAMHHFAGLLDSSDSRLIARCDSCKVYFAYERARLRTVTRGVFCQDCKTKGSVKRTQESRSRRIETAARAIVAGQPKRVALEHRLWIAEQVNAVHGTVFGRRWVSQNWNAIQTQAEVLRNAKG
jgi:hypothetical protein